MSNDSLSQMMSDTTTDPVDYQTSPSQRPNVSPAPDGRLVGKTVSALAVACHNLAVETEFTQGGSKALGWYKRSAELVKVVNDEDTNILMRQKVRTGTVICHQRWQPTINYPTKPAPPAATLPP